MARDKAAIRETLRSVVDFSADFHTLNSGAVEALVDAARANAYRKPKNANGSTARYFFAYLNRRG
ncbi:hypothetical protein I4940_08035 [Pseudomonas aeruginosa]|uniref:hypothetical protein n=1 Tax=Pseudomonas aeruginosa TaxID=287 RepID=UPI000448F19A|nr:hypothetical protein [Pseudomonas aeruginosa]KAJ09066.1 hypothetical protein M003_17920 [Pseudomonas aeruginosa IGB83]MBG4400751.1 hypothetical protein [Pseudomonas aeruginosa]MBG7570811.1 hypothetical protein [Pseudomonas aeruginosa]MCL8044774.1 hypothetical protein [Pseudomonas aeruginosa]HEO1552411.1 hypothetical protein [Pseudomonas aeruginosa]